MVPKRACSLLDLKTFCSTNILYIHTYTHEVSHVSSISRPISFQRFVGPLFSSQACPTDAVLLLFSFEHLQYYKRAGRSGDRIPVGATFSAPVQTGPGTQPASFTRGTVSFPGVKRRGLGVDHPTPSNADVEGRVELYICWHSGTSWPALG